MASLKELRNRIASVTATQKITRAMQMVAAAKLRRAREAAESARPYAERMTAVIANLATADRGLAGGFNSSIVRAARDHIAAKIAEGREVSLITVGRKARDQLKRLYGERQVAFFEAGNVPTMAKARELTDAIIGRFETGEADVVTLFFNRFVSVVSQVPTLKQLVPAQIVGGEGGRLIDLKGAAYEYEPDEATILATLLPRNIATQILSALMENQVGFFASQMAAMDAATRNAGDMIADLTLIKNRTRQAQITKELIEIISGAEAL